MKVQLNFRISCLWVTYVIQLQHKLALLTGNNPKHKTVTHHRGDHYQGEGQGPEHVQVSPGDGGDGSENVDMIKRVKVKQSFF